MIGVCKAVSLVPEAMGRLYRSILLVYVEELGSRYQKCLREFSVSVRVDIPAVVRQCLWYKSFAADCEDQSLYVPGHRDRKVVDEILDKMHDHGHVKQTEDHTPVFFPIFVVWKNMKWLYNWRDMGIG